MRAALVGLFIAVSLLACTSQSAFADEPAVLDVPAADAAPVSDNGSSDTEPSIDLPVPAGLSEEGEPALESEVPGAFEEPAASGDPEDPEGPEGPEDPKGSGGLPGVEYSDSAVPAEYGGGVEFGGVGYFDSATSSYGEIAFKEAQPEEPAAGERVRPEDDCAGAPKQEPQLDEDKPGVAHGKRKTTSKRKVDCRVAGASSVFDAESVGVSPAPCEPASPVSDLAFSPARGANDRVELLGLMPEESSARTVQTSPDCQSAFIADSAESWAVMLVGSALHAGDAAALAREGDPVRCRSPSFA